MDIYLSVLKLSYHWFRRYPIEFWANVGKRFLQVIFMLLLWILIAEQNPKAETSTEELIIYFVITSGIADLVMVERLNLGRVVSKAIKQGELNSFLTKPIGIIRYYYASVMGKLIPTYLFSIATIAAVSLIGGNSFSLYGIVFGLIALIMAAILGVFINMFIGIMTFVIVETRNLEYMTQIIIRIFAGAYIPLQFYPDEIRKILDLTFFPTLAYVPTNFWLHGENADYGLEYLIIPIIWIIILGILSIGLWNYFMKKYEAIGI